MAGTKHTERIYGVLKSSPDDFVVEEIPLYEPCGKGEHLYLTVCKSNVSHDELIRKVAKKFGVPRRNIGCAGRKDLKAVTTQVLSIHLPGQQVERPNHIGAIEVVSSNWHTNKLRLGHLKGNRFSILLREVQPSSYKLIEERLVELMQQGLPNAFGNQRFGNKLNNHILGRCFVLEDWDVLVQMLLKGEERHHDYAKMGEYKQALDAWPFGQPAERNVLEALANGKSNQQACKTISHSLRKLWINAFQSTCFNEVLKRRIKEKTWDKIIEGDLVCRNDAWGRTFNISTEELESEDIVERLNSFAISPSGPLWGVKMRMASGEARAIEQEELKKCGVTESNLLIIKKDAKGSRRPLRVSIGNASMETVDDSIRLRFDLPAGSYATVVVQYLLNGEI